MGQKSISRESPWGPKRSFRAPLREKERERERESITPRILWDSWVASPVQVMSEVPGVKVTLGVPQKKSERPND